MSFLATDRTLRLAALFELFCRRRVPSAAFDSLERHPVPKCQRNTRVDVRLKVERWFGEDHDRPICWLRGLAGSGKSAIAQTIAEKYDQDGQLAASFFFDQQNTGCGSITGFVPTIASQLATSVPLTRTSMERVLQIDPFIADRMPRYQFKRLIIEPLLELGKLISPKVIVIDALDQCDRVWVEEIFALLAIACQYDQFPLRFCLTSRAEGYLDVLFKQDTIQCKTHYLTLDEFDARDDIRRFFHEQFLRWDYPVPPNVPSPLELDRLVAKSSGLFIIASELVRFFNDGSDLPHRKLQTALEMQADLNSISASAQAVCDLISYVQNFI